MDTKLVIISMYELGCTYKEIASEVGITDTSVRERVLRLIDKGELRERESKTRKIKPQNYVLDLTFSNLEYELSQYIIPKYDLEVDKGMDNMIIKLVNPRGILSETLLEYPFENLEGEIVSNFAKRILKDGRKAKFTPVLRETFRERSEEEDLRYIGAQSLRYFMEGYNQELIKGFIKFKKDTTRDFVWYYRHNVDRFVNEDVVDDYGNKLKEKDTD